MSNPRRTLPQPRTVLCDRCEYPHTRRVLTHGSGAAFIGYHCPACDYVTHRLGSDDLAETLRYEAENPPRSVD